MSQTARRPFRTEARRIADLVQEAIDDGATTVEDIHKRIAAVPLEALERMDIFEKKTLRDVRKIQEASLGAVYDAIREVNQDVARFAKQLLAKRPAAPKSAAAKPARKPVARGRVGASAPAAAR